MDRDRHGDLPALRATIRLGGPADHALNSLSVFDVEFYPYSRPGADAVFAVCSGPHAIVCRCVVARDCAIEVLHWFQMDPQGPQHHDAKAPSTRPLYNSLTWSRAANGDALLLAAGAGSHAIHVFNVSTKELVTTLIGHGDDINDMAVSPADPTILASCSVDHSLRLWSLAPAHAKQPLAAICYGQGHRQQILTLAYHPTGRFILSADMDTKINLWLVPDATVEHAGTDKPLMIHYPHFATTEVHTDFVDCIQWYHDLIFSHACREDKIIMWKIDGFSSDHAHIPDAPIPTSMAIKSTTPVTVPTNSTSGTRSAWGGRLQRLLQFHLPNTNQFYMRFSIFHELGRHPILVAGNEKSKAFFWDLQRLEHAGTGADESGQTKRPTLLPLPQHVREPSVASDASSALSTASAASKSKRKKAKRNDTPEEPRDRGISDPFMSIKAHKIIEVPKYLFAFRQFAWSRDGQWCVGVADSGLINVFHRWEKGIPPIKTESQTSCYPSASKPI
ncbi:hypothetical protein ACEQ8H_004930 [Pleosporales sp. CAS-2024a]